VRAQHRTGDLAVPEDREGAVRRPAAVEAEELKLVRLRHTAVEVGLVDEHSEWPFTLRIGRVAPPRAVDLPESVGSEIAEEHLVRGVREGVFVRAERAGESFQQTVTVGGQLPRGLRSMPDEVRSVRQDEAAAVNCGAHELTVSAVPCAFVPRA
jgi:hypothetical protein